MSAAAVLALALASAPACERADLMPALPQKVNERALLDAACGPECVVECSAADEEAAPEDAKQHLFSHYEGSFRCLGRQESIVSLFPCGDAVGMHGIAGRVVLVQSRKGKGRAPRWEAAGEVEQTVLSGGCKVVRVGERDVLVCLSSWGPYQGVTGESLCVLRWSDELGMECFLRVEDSCMAALEGAFAAEVKSWSVDRPAPDGTVPVHLQIERKECDGKRTRTVEAVVVVDAAGARLDAPSVARLKKVPVSLE